MNRRAFLAGLLALPAVPFAFAERFRPVPIQESPLAGFQYHQGPQVWAWLRVGEALRLAREPENPYDRRAVALYWNGYKLGYLPRAENAAVAHMLDHGQRLAAHIARLRESPDPWQRLRVAVDLLVPV